MVPEFIFLTGFMGSGKSTLGKKTAALLGYRFIDLDEQIEKAEGHSISAIFSQKGEAYFRQQETRQLEALMNTAGGLLVSLGGGTVCSEHNLALVKNKGLLVYIEMPPTALAVRLQQGQAERPLISKVSPAELPEFISVRLNERLPYYNQAHIRISGLNLTPQQLKTAISEQGGLHI